MDFWTDDRVEAYLTGVEDPTEMIVLDLFSEAAPQWNRTQSYYSKKWIWCLLHGTIPFSPFRLLFLGSGFPGFYLLFSVICICLLRGI
jgi:hypothetical protein